MLKVIIVQISTVKHSWFPASTSFSMLPFNLSVNRLGENFYWLCQKFLYYPKSLTNFFSKTTKKTLLWHLQWIIDGGLQSTEQILLIIIFISGLIAACLDFIWAYL